MEKNVKMTLRLEGLMVFSLSTSLYFQQSPDWLLFAGLFFLPDLMLLGYIISNKVGATLYNFSHSYTLPLLVALVFTICNYDTALLLVWVAHIGFDRMLGYGLKYQEGFNFTHLGKIGNPH